MTSLNSSSTFPAARDRLLARRRELLDRAQNVEADRRRQRDPLSADAPDRAVQMQNDDVIDRIGEAARDELNVIAAALGRIDAGNYGVCETCCGEIEARRLSAIPYAVQCQSCAAQASS